MINSWNDRILITIATSGLFLAIAFSTIVIKFPNETFDKLDNISIKFLIIICIFLAIAALAILIYFFTYHPPARRLILILFTFLLGGMVAFGSPSLKKVDIISDINQKNLAFNVEFYEQNGHGLTILSIGIILLVTVGFYIYVTIYEKKNGPLD